MYPQNKLLVLLFISFLLTVNGCKVAPVEPIPPATSITGPVLYDPDVQLIMFNNCLSCHSGPAPSADLRLDNYTNVRNTAEQGNLLLRINDELSPMPPAGRMRTENRDRIAKWIQDGFPEQ